MEGEKCNALDRKQNTLILWIAMWEELNHFRAREISIEVGHVKANRTKKERQQMSLFEQIINKGNEHRTTLQKKERF